MVSFQANEYALIVTTIAPLAVKKRPILLHYLYQTAWSITIFCSSNDLYKHIDKAIATWKMYLKSIILWSFA